MKMNKIMAFLIVLSMIVGLVFATPASAALDVIENYVEVLEAEEYFDGSSYDRGNFYVDNGTVAEGTLNFELDKESGVSYRGILDLTNNGQYVIEFDLATEVTYTNPWTASFIGFNLESAAQKPTAEENGAWIGITQDKVILWFSNHRSSFLWGENEDIAIEGTDYYVFDAPVSFQEASFRLIVESDAKELQFKNGDVYETLATLETKTHEIAEGEETKKYTRETFTLADETTYFMAAADMKYEGFNTYFTIANQTSDVVEDDPFNPDMDSELAPAPLKASVDNIKVTVYTVSYVTDEQIATILEKKAELESILEAYNTEGEEDDIYKKNSIDVEILEKYIADAEEKATEEGLLSEEADEFVAAIDALVESLVSMEAAAAFEADVAQYISNLNDALIEAENGTEEFSVDAINDVKALAETSYATVAAEGLTNEMLDEALALIKTKFEALDLYSPNGFKEIFVPFDETTKLSVFDEDILYRTGNKLDDVISSEYGIPVGVQFGGEAGILPGQFKISLDKSLESTYSVKATLKDSAAWSTMIIRGLPGSNNTYEPDGSLIGSQYGIGLYGLQLNHRGSEVDLIVKDGQHGGARAWSTVSVGDVEGAQISGTDTITVLVKDYGEIIEFYLLDAEENATKIFSLLLDSEIKNVSFNRNSGQYPEIYSYDCQTDGVIVNHIAGEVIEFSDMRIPALHVGAVGFQGREGKMYVKDLAINTKIKADDLYVDGFSLPEALSFVLDSEGDLNVGDEVTFSVVADFEEVKVAGRDKFKAATMDVTHSVNTTYSTLCGDSVISVDKCGKIIAIAEGTDVVTATYTYVDGDVEKTKISSVFITVSGEGFTAPSEGAVINDRIECPEFANASAFKSVDKGTEIIPLISYKLFNGDVEYLARDKYAVFSTSDASIIEYDYATGKYVAKEAGIAEVWAEVHTAAEVVETAKVYVEVTEAGEMTPGVNTAFAVNEILEAAKDLDDAEIEDLKKIVDSAISQGINIQYADDTDIILMFKAFEKVSEEAGKEEIEEAYKESVAVKAVYTIVTDEETTATALGEYLFGREDNYKIFGIDEAAYSKLSKSKKSTALKRAFTQLDKKGTNLTASAVGKIFNNIVDLTAESGHSKSESNTNKTNDRLGNNVFIAPGTPAVTGTPASKPGRLSDADAMAKASTFADIEESAWAKSAIGRLYAENIVSGYEDGTIKPNKTITRDEFVKLLVCAFNFKLEGAGTSFTDVALDAWQNTYINTAFVNGILTGNEDGTFGSGVEITRQDMAVMIMKAADKLGVAFNSDNTVTFEDTKDISGYALEAINKLAATGIINGMGDNTFAPTASATRAQAMQIIDTVKGLIK